MAAEIVGVGYAALILPTGYGVETFEEDFHAVIGKFAIIIRSRSSLRVNAQKCV